MLPYWHVEYYADVGIRGHSPRADRMRKKHGVEVAVTQLFCEESENATR
jgi:hypothetical protein